MSVSDGGVILLGVCVGRWRPALLGWARAPLASLRPTTGGHLGSKAPPPGGQPQASAAAWQRNILMSIAIL